MFIPPQGFRHATALLLTQGCRAIPPGASPDSVASALAALAHDLVALADDMHAAPESAEWLLVEYGRVVEQLPHTFDRSAAQASASTILARVASRRPVVESRDLFLVYVPEDRLPVAAPLGVELIKRRVSVALDYEVVTGPQLSAALDHGLEHHRAGVVLRTRAFERVEWGFEVQESDRLRVISASDAAVAAADLAEWMRRLHPVKTAGS
jgi:hypothetical protein